MNTGLESYPHPDKASTRIPVVVPLPGPIEMEPNIYPCSKAERSLCAQAAEWASSQKFEMDMAEATRAHQLRESFKKNGFLDDSGDFVARGRTLTEPLGTFLIQHDWASAIGSQALEVGNDFRIPYDVSAFEMKINGRPFIAIACQREDYPIVTLPFVSVGGVWISFGGGNISRYPVLQRAWDQVRACCVALDAEVATHSIVRAPQKLNMKRERYGKPKVMDSHIIDLAKRHRSEKIEGTGTGNRKRLHFRRGHWRHFESHKTWINWMLVGNPELGFIDHEYKL